MPITQHADLLKRSFEGVPILCKENQRTPQPKLPDVQGLTNSFRHETFHIRELSITAPLLPNTQHLLYQAVVRIDQHVVSLEAIEVKNELNDFKFSSPQQGVTKIEPES